MSSGDSLRGLQDVDSRLASLRTELAAARETLRRDPELERRTAALAAATASRERDDEAAGAAERTLADLENRVRSLDRRLYGGSVHNPHELLEMQRELETLRVQASEAEAAALRLMQAAEDSARNVDTARRALTEQERARTESLQPLRSRLAALEQELAAATGERETALAAVDARDLALYQRVASHHQPAVVPLQGDACGGCHLPLSIEERRLVRSGDGVVQCPSCDRILVR